jgi:hypothetical protein
MLEKIRKFVRKNALPIFLAFVPPIAIWYYLERERREVTVSLRAAIPVVSLNAPLSKGVRIYYGDKQIRTLTAYELEIRNSGNRPIERSDFDAPLSIDFAGELLQQPELIRSSPETMKPEFRTENSCITLEKLLLNAGDFLCFRIRSISGPGIADPFRVEGHIVGADINTKGFDKLETRHSSPFILMQPWLVSATLLLSLASLITVLRRARRLAMPLQLGEANRLSDSLEKEGVLEDARSLAECLGVQSYDKKGSLLSIRITIQKALWKIAQEMDIQAKPGKDSLVYLTEQLRRDGVLDPEVAIAIMDILPVINGELDSPDSYLTEREFDTIVRLGLNVAARLQRMIKRRAHRAKPGRDIVLQGRADDSVFAGRIVDYSLDGSGLCIETGKRILSGAHVEFSIAGRNLPAVSVWSRRTSEGDYLAAFEAVAISSWWVKHLEMQHDLAGQRSE